MQKIVVAYIPVIHHGYLDYLASTGAKKVYVLQAKDLLEFPQLQRDIRALTFVQLSQALNSFGYEVFEFSDLKGKVLPEGTKIYVPEDDITRDLIFEGEVIWGNAFLRWDWTKSTTRNLTQPEADRILRKGDSDYQRVVSQMQLLNKEIHKSSDWWRQVSASVVATNGVSITAYNKHQPTEYAPYFDGDPRDNFNPGEHVEIYTSHHGETSVIDEAARRGIALEGSDFFVSTFPCNICANSIVHCGSKRLFFTGGYSNLNGQKTLRDRKVELIYVEI